MIKYILLKKPHGGGIPTIEKAPIKNAVRVNGIFL